MINLKFDIKENEFDSGILAPKAGELLFQDLKDLKEEIPGAINFARSNNFKFVSLKTNELVSDIEYLKFAGCIETLESTPEIVLKNIPLIERKYIIKFLEDVNFTDIEKMLSWAPPTRFSNDSMLSSSQVTLHKIKILNHLKNKFPEYSLGAFTEKGELIGFHFLRPINKDITFLQELLIKPNHRIGFASLQLVSHGINLLTCNTSTKTLSTKIYTENKTSLDFFRKLGFSLTGKKEYYYHIWI